jgi:hypothetical protein
MENNFPYYFFRENCNTACLGCARNRYFRFYITSKKPKAMFLDLAPKNFLPKYQLLSFFWQKKARKMPFLPNFCVLLNHQKHYKSIQNGGFDLPFGQKTVS